jgi:hypothetical protein
MTDLYAVAEFNIDINAPGPFIGNRRMEWGDKVLLTRQRQPAENGVWVWYGSMFKMHRAED